VNLETLKATDFRNLRGQIACRPGLNILVGDNGQGKTNWLEAIFLLATTRSFKTARLQETISFGSEMAIVGGQVRQSHEIVHDVQAVITPTSKAFSINGKREYTTRYIGELHAVVFNADEMEIVRGLPEARRRFLDNGIVSIYPAYLQTITDYNRVIKQKNSLLQSARDQELSLEKTSEALSPWNEQLAAHAARIHGARVRFVERLNEVLEKHLFSSEGLVISYASALENKGDLSNYEGLITERLNLRVTAELNAGHSLIGPHRDDMEILLDGHDLRRYGSSGQQRSALLLLQLANITVFNSQRGEYPLFLLDDIDSELDYKRIGQLLEFLQDKTQTFTTTSKENFVQNFGSGAAIFTIESGQPKSP
jgi:DNA replication and repair protein RecF